MSKIPKLKNWESTKNALHQSMQVLRSASIIDAKQLPNKLEYSSFVTNYGVVSRPLSFGGELKLDFTKQKIIYSNGEEDIFSVKLIGHSQVTLFDNVFSELEKAGHKLRPNRDNVIETKRFKINPAQAKKYAEIQFRIFTAFAYFKSRLLGPQTPIVIWPHGFDLSFMWFKKGINEKKDPHMNFGFSPGFGVNPKPYLYFYAWPVPQGLVKRKLPANGKWMKDWSTPGAMFELKYFEKITKPEQQIAKLLYSQFKEISKLIK